MYEVQFIFCSLFLEEIEFFKYSVKQKCMFCLGIGNCDVSNFFFWNLRRITIWAAGGDNFLAFCRSTSLSATIIWRVNQEVPAGGPGGPSSHLTKKPQHRETCRPGWFVVDLSSLEHHPFSHLCVRSKANTSGRSLPGYHWRRTPRAELSRGRASSSWRRHQALNTAPKCTAFGARDVNSPRLLPARTSATISPVASPSAAPRVFHSVPPERFRSASSRCIAHRRHRQLVSSMCFGNSGTSSHLFGVDGNRMACETMHESDRVFCCDSQSYWSFWRVPLYRTEFALRRVIKLSVNKTRWGIHPLMQIWTLAQTNNTVSGFIAEATSDRDETIE